MGANTVGGLGFKVKSFRSRVQSPIFLPAQQLNASDRTETKFTDVETLSRHRQVLDPGYRFSENALSGKTRFQDH